MADTPVQHEGCQCPMADCPNHPSAACGIKEPHLYPAPETWSEGDDIGGYIVKRKILWMCQTCIEEVQKRVAHA